jgi:transposase
VTTNWLSIPSEITFSAMNARQSLESVRDRLNIVLAHLDGRNQSEIAKDLKTTRPTVRKWVRRFEESGLEGLISEKPTGRPREVHPTIRNELVRLPQESRPPADLGDQWTTRTLAEVFGVSDSFVSDVWREEGFDPPQHLQQVERNPDRRVRLRVDLTMPAWLKLHLEIVCREKDRTLGEHLLGALMEWNALRELRDEIIPALPGRWTNENEKLPRVDPRSWAFKLELEKREGAE